MAHTCPIDQEKINEPTVRVVAILIGITLLTAFFINQFWLYALIALDFLIRGFGKKEYSYYRWLAIQIVNNLDIQANLIPALPKRFAAKIGFVFSLFLILFSSLQLVLPFQITALILGSCIVLEAAFGYCVGCQFYSLLVRFRILKSE